MYPNLEENGMKAVELHRLDDCSTAFDCPECEPGNAMRYDIGEAAMHCDACDQHFDEESLKQHMQQSIDRYNLLRNLNIATNV